MTGFRDKTLVNYTPYLVSIGYLKSLFGLVVNTKKGLVKSISISVPNSKARSALVR
jgi:hypothetical protein